VDHNLCSTAQALVTVQHYHVSGGKAGHGRTPDVMEGFADRSQIAVKLRLNLLSVGVTVEQN